MAKEMTPQAASADEEKQRIRDEKKKLKKELKHRDLDYEGLDSDEMRKLLEDHFKEI